MFKRIIWMGVGAAAGSAGTVWAQRKVRSQVDRATQRIAPANATRAVRERVEGLGQRVRGAVEEGRSTMNETEADLRERVNLRTSGSVDRSSLPPPGNGSRQAPR